MLLLLEQNKSHGGGCQVGHSVKKIILPFLGEKITPYLFFLHHPPLRGRWRYQVGVSGGRWIGGGRCSSCVCGGDKYQLCIAVVEST